MSEAIDYNVDYPPPPDMPNALCQFTDPEIFFPISPKEYEEGRKKERELNYKGKFPRGKAIKPLDTAKNICKMCDHISPCREYAVVNFVSFGVWGATTAKERSMLRRLMYTKELLNGEETA